MFRGERQRCKTVNAVQTIEEWFGLREFYPFRGFPRAKRSVEIQKEMDPDDYD